MTYRQGVLTGDYIEHLASKGIPPPPPAFEGTTTSAAAFPAAERCQATAAASRDGVRLKYCKYGRTEPLGEGSTGFYATVGQLAFDPAATRAEGGQRAEAPPKIQDCLWAGSKHVDGKAPRSMPARRLAEERERDLRAAAERDRYLTAEKEALKKAAEDTAARVDAKPPAARPKAEGGQEAQVGRKADGEFRRHLDKDWLRIGLRRAAAGGGG